MGIILRVWFLSLQTIKFIIYKSLKDIWSHFNFLSSQKWYFKIPPKSGSCTKLGSWHLSELLSNSILFGCLVQVHQ
jgi:hypothetical protein